MATAEARVPVIRSTRTKAPDLAGPVTASVVVHFLLLAAFVATFHGDISSLVCLDKAKVGRVPYELVTSGFDTVGYDGQFYYVLAQDPWHAAADGSIDLPAYRHVRILYPALAWALSGGGDPARLLWTLPAINLVAIGVLAWLGATLAIAFGRSSWWGFLLPIGLDVGLSALRDLTDPLAATAVCGLLTAHLLGWRPAWLGLWAAAAVLSREQNLVIVGVVMLGCLAMRRWTHAAALLAAIGLLFGWVAVLYAFYDALPLALGNLTTPFGGMWWRVTHFEGVPAHVYVLHMMGMALLGTQVIIALLMPFTRPRPAIMMTALAGAMLTILASTAIYEDWNSYMRVLVWMPLGIWLWSVQTGRRWPIALISLTALWPILAVGARLWRAL